MMLSPRPRHQATVRIPGPAQSIIGFGRRDYRLRKRDLVFEGQAYQLGFLDRFVGHLLRCSHDEIADAASLNFGRTFHDSQGFRGDPGLQAGRTNRILGHFGFPFLEMYGRLPDNSSFAMRCGWFRTKQSAHASYESGATSLASGAALSGGQSLSRSSGGVAASSVRV